MNQIQRLTRFPIGIRMFNRPEYTERFLLSLLNQTLDLDQSRIICFIDGYEKSSDYFQKIPDRTQAVADLVAKYLPGARLIRPDSNQGLARALFDLQKSVYEMDDSAWGIFLEDDLVLDPSYLEVLEHLIGLASQTEQVVKVAACQIHTGYQQNPLESNRRDFFIGEGTKAFAEASTYFSQRQDLTQTYLATLAGVSYRHRNRERVFAKLATKGIFSVMGNNDGVLDQIMAHFQKLHIVTGRNFAKDIGIVGESNFVIPEIKAPQQDAEEILATSFSDLQRALPHLESELGAIQDKYFSDLWQVYRRADSITHTTKFIARKLMGKFIARVGLNR